MVLWCLCWCQLGDGFGDGDGAQVQEMMGQADKDGTNSLDIIEFLQAPSWHEIILMFPIIDIIVTLTNYIYIL